MTPLTAGNIPLPAVVSARTAERPPPRGHAAPALRRRFTEGIAMRKLAIIFVLSLVLLPGAGLVRAAGTTVGQLVPVGGSGVSGIVQLKPASGPDDGADIRVVAHGLQPGGHYLSIYYDNPVCQLAPDSLTNDVIGRYTANPGGVGMTQGHADDPIDEIDSVSVRLDNGTTEPPLLACATF
jgi:hypothetical protein